MSTIDELQTAFRSAQALSEAYATEITEKYRQEYPEPTEWRGPSPEPDTALARARAWTDQERAELARLRQDAQDAVLKLHRARQAAAQDGREG